MWAGIWSINLESSALVVARFQMKKNAAPFSLWLLILLGINWKIKCFPDVVFAVMVMCTRPIASTCVQCAALMLLLWGKELFTATPGPRSQPNGVRVISASCSNAPSQLDALRLAALQLDAGFLILWTASFSVPWGHFTFSLLKACCSACFRLNGAKERQSWQPAGIPEGLGDHP